MQRILPVSSAALANPVRTFRRHRVFPTDIFILLSRWYLLALSWGRYALRWTAVLALGLPGAGALGQSTPQIGAVAQQDAQHQRALVELEQGRYSAAIQGLNAVISRESGNVGAWLDLGIAYCLSGNLDAASRIFLTLESRDDLPAGVAEVLAFYRTGGCRSRPIGVQGFVSAGVGYATNVNLAPQSALIALPGLGVDLMLQPDSQPRRSAFRQFEIGFLYALTSDEAWSLGANAQGQRYREAGDLGLDSSQVNLNFRHPSEGVTTEGQLTYARLWLGGRSHLGVFAGSATALRRLGGPWRAGVIATASRLSFTELSAFDSIQYEGRARLLWQGSPARVTLDVGWVEDRPGGERPGGLRRGPLIQARIQVPAGALGAFDLSARRTWLRDVLPYNETLFGDLSRSSHQISLQAGWRMPITKQTALRLEYRLQNARDTISLFTYNAQTLSMALEWFFAK